MKITYDESADCFDSAPMLALAGAYVVLKARGVEVDEGTVVRVTGLGIMLPAPDWTERLVPWDTFDEVEYQ